MHRFLRAVVLAGVVLGLSSAGALANPTGVAEIGRILPTVADVPGAGLAPRSEEPIGANALRAPFPCPARDARGVRATTRWGEWAAEGDGRRARVLVFAYSEASIGRVWRRFRAAIAACPSTTRVVEDDGSRGTAVQVIRSSGPGVIRMDILTRSAAGDRAWSRDRAVVYRRVGDLIVKAQVSRQVLRPGDRVLAARLVRITRGKFLAGNDDAEVAPPATDVSGAVDALISRVTGSLPAGAKLHVSIGDSMLSGEGGRWRGNVFWYVNWPRADAYGEQTYWDSPTGETLPGCHRAKGAPIHIPGTHSLNLACSGAKTTSGWGFGEYKPGIDEGTVDPRTGARLPGQLTMLDQVARRAPIGTIALSIGGNDLGFLDVVTACVGAFLRPWPFEARCKDDAATRERLSDASLAAAGRKIEAAIVRVHATMRAAGYADGSWQMVVQNYPRLVAEDGRYPDTYAGRLYAGGCPIHSEDLPFFNERLPMTDTIRLAADRASATTGIPIRFVDISGLFAGRELCARGAEHVDRLQPGDVVTRAERVAMIRVFPPFLPTEGMHPNQIGQQAVQACLREVIAAARSGRCEAPLDWSQVDAVGLPQVRFVPAGR